MSSNSELSIYAISKLIDELKNTDVGSLKNDIEKLTNLINTNTTNISTNSDEIIDIKNSLNKKSTENTESLEEIKDLIATKFAQKGSSTQPVYVDSTGTIQGTTFGLNSTVPENAKFTDTTYKLNNSVSNNTLKINLNSSASDDSSSVSIIGSENISIENSGSTAVLKHIKGDAKNTLATTTTDKKTDGSIAFGGTVKIPTISYDDQGHIVSSSTTDVVLPNTQNLTITDGSNSATYNAQSEKTLKIVNGTNTTANVSTKDNVITVKYDSTYVDTKNTVGTTTKTDSDLYLVGVSDKTGSSTQSYVDGKAKINNGVLTVDNIVVNKGITVNSSNVVTEKTYTADNGIKIENNVIKHRNSITAGTASGSSGQISSGGTVKIPTISYDAQGHITATSTTTINLPKVDENGNATATDENVKQELLISTNAPNKTPLLSSTLVDVNAGTEECDKEDYIGGTFRINEINYSQFNNELCVPGISIGKNINLSSRISSGSNYAGGTILLAVGEEYSNPNGLGSICDLNSYYDEDKTEIGYYYPLIVSKDMVEMFKTKGKKGAANVTIKNVTDSEGSKGITIRNSEYIDVSPDVYNVVFPGFFYCSAQDNNIKGVSDKKYGNFDKYCRELVCDGSSAELKRYCNFSFYQDRNLVTSFQDTRPSLNIRVTTTSEYLFFGRNIQDKTNNTYFRVPKLIMGIDSNDRGKIIYSNNLKIKYKNNAKKNKTYYSGKYAGVNTDEYDTRMAFKSDEIDVLNVPLKGGVATTNSQTMKTKTTTYWEINSDGQAKFSDVFIKNNDSSTSISKLFGNKTEYLVTALNTISDTGTSSKIFRDNCDLLLETTADDNGARLTEFINSVPAGSTIKFAPGRYEFKDTIYITKAINLTGMNHNAIFVKCEPDSNLSKGGTPIFKIGKYYNTVDNDGNACSEGTVGDIIGNVSIENIYFDSNDDYQTAPFIKVANLNGFYFKRNRFGVRKINRTGDTNINAETWKEYKKAYFFIKVEQYLANALVSENVWNFKGNIYVENGVTKGTFPETTTTTTVNDVKKAVCNDSCVQIDFTDLGKNFSMVYGASWEYFRYYKKDSRDMSQLILYGVRPMNGQDALVVDIKSSDSQSISYKNDDTTITNTESKSTVNKSIYAYNLVEDTSTTTTLAGTNISTLQYTKFSGFGRINDEYPYCFTKKLSNRAIGRVYLCENDTSTDDGTNPYSIPKGTKIKIIGKIVHLDSCENNHSSEQEQYVTGLVNVDNGVNYIYANSNEEIAVTDAANKSTPFEFDWTTAQEGKPLYIEFVFPINSMWDVKFDVKINGTSITKIKKNVVEDD